MIKTLLILDYGEFVSTSNAAQNGSERESSSLVGQKPRVGSEPDLNRTNIRLTRFPRSLKISLKVLIGQYYITRGCEFLHAGIL